MSIQAGTHQIGPSNGSLKIKTGREGAAAKAGHDLVLEATSWDGTVEIGENRSSERGRWQGDARAPPELLRQPSELSFQLDVTRAGHELAALPQLCLRSDRRSSYEQWGLPLADALSNEFGRGAATIASGETLDGATRFAAGAGRHGAPASESAT